MGVLLTRFPSRFDQSLLYGNLRGVVLDLYLEPADQNHCLDGYRAAAGTVCCFLSQDARTSETRKRCNKSHLNTNFIERKSGGGRVWSWCRRGAGEWVAGSLTRGTSNEESSCLFIDPDTSTDLMLDWLEDATREEDGNLVLYRHHSTQSVLFMSWRKTNMAVCLLKWLHMWVICLQRGTCFQTGLEKKTHDRRQERRQLIIHLAA